MFAKRNLENRAKKVVYNIVTSHSNLLGCSKYDDRVNKRKQYSSGANPKVEE